MVTLTCHQAALESLASTCHSSEASEPFISFSAHCTTPKPPPPSTSARLSRPQTSHTPLSFPPSILHPGNPGSPSDNDPENDDDDDDNDYEDADNGTQEDWAVQVFESLTHAIDSLAHASRKSGSSSLEPKCTNPTLLMALTPRSCTPSWCNANSISKTTLAQVWPSNGSSQAFCLLEILDPIPCGWTTGLSSSLSSSQPSASTTQFLMLKTSLTTFK
ncbi:hypothetical protein ID866_11035 [Astraeus odoratus]|nr:hypothetical protein ID866_11035 [Astraeus odoratus]